MPLLPDLFQLGECPRWNEREELLCWVDINSFRIHRCKQDGTGHEFRQFNEEVGSFSFRKSKGLVLAMRSGFYLMNEWNSEPEFIADPEGDKPETRFNDGRCDAKGRMLAGTYCKKKGRSISNLWSLDSSGLVKQLLENYDALNGTAFSPDGRTFYYSDTRKSTVFKCTYEPITGSLSTPQMFYKFAEDQGRPDGAAVDQEGCYWTALYGGGRVVRINELSQIVDEVVVPTENPTMVAFGGVDLKTLYITTARNDTCPLEDVLSGRLFYTNVDVSGIVDYRFAG